MDKIDNILSLPFLTRKMLSFEGGAVFDVEVNLLSTVAATFVLIGMGREGIFKFNIPHSGSGASENTVKELPDIPTTVTLFTEDTAVERGEAFCTMYLRVNGERVLRLASGYVSENVALGWPTAQNDSIIAGGGKFKSVVSTNPAAGAEATLAVTTNEHWILKGAKITLVTDATVSNRRVHLSIDAHGYSGAFHAFGSVDQPASKTYDYYFAPYGVIPTELNNNSVLIPIPPDIHLIQGDNLLTSTLNLQVGDDFGTLKVFVEQYFEG